MKHKTAWIAACLGILALGVVCIFLGHRKGGSLNFSIDLKNREVVTSEALTEGSYAMDAPEKLVIQTNVADVTVQPGEAFSVEYALREIPNITEENGVFTIGEKRSGAALMQFGFTHREDDPHIVITIPAAVSLELESDVGNVRIENVALKDVKIDVDVGDLTLQDVQAESLTTETNTGGTEITNVTVSGAAGLESDVGDITITDLTAASITVENDVGDIHAELPAGDYAIDAETDIGAVYVNDHDEGSRYHADGTIPLELKTDTGDIRIRLAD